MEHLLYVIYIDANHVMLGPPDLQHYIPMVWNILYMFSSLNFMPIVKKIPFHAFFRTGTDDLVTGSDDFWGRLGLFWWQKHFLERERVQILFQFQRSSFGSLLHLWSILKNVFKPASNDFECICEQSWKDQCSMEVYNTIIRTKSYCSKLLTKLVITTKNFFLYSLCYLSELLPLVTCKQRADHFTPMMWFEFIRWRFHFIRRLFLYSN